MNDKVEKKRGRPRKERSSQDYGPRGIKCSQLFDLVYLRDEDPLYFMIHDVSLSSRNKIKRLVANHIAPFFKKYVYASDITLVEVSGFRSYLEKKRLSAKYRQDIHSYAKAAFSMLNDIDPGHVYRNVFDSKSLVPIRTNPFEHRTPSFELEDIHNLFSRKWKHPLVESMALFCAYTGARPNEVAALQKEDFTIHEEFVEVFISRNWVPSVRETKGTKTAAGTRHVVLPVKVFKYIKPALFWQEGSLCFSLDGKTHLSYLTYSKYLNMAMKENGVRNYQGRGLVMYSFRPFYKSYSSGLPEELSNYVMGHSGRGMGDRYWHYQTKLHAPLLAAVTKDLLPLSGTAICGVYLYG